MQSIIAGILITVIGALLCLNPSGVWKMTESRKTPGAAGASASFLKILRAVGAALMIAGVLVCTGVLH